jgi:hypothetical protein
VWECNGGEQGKARQALASRDLDRITAAMSRQMRCATNMGEMGKEKKGEGEGHVMPRWMRVLGGRTCEGSMKSCE